MNQKFTISAILFLLSVFAFGQGTVHKINQEIRHSVGKRHSGVLTQIGSNVLHNPSQLKNRSFSEGALIKTEQSAKQVLDSLIIQDWDETSKGWVAREKDVYSYDENGFATGTIYNYFDETISQWIPFDKDIYTNNASGIMTQEDWYEWDEISSQWVAYYKIVYSYNASDKLTQYIISESDDTGSILLTRSKTDYMYDASGNLIQSFTYDSDGTPDLWIATYKDEYIYNANGNLTQNLEYSWDEISGTWVDYYNTEYAYDANDNMSQCTEYYSEKNQWLVYTKYEYTYDDDDNMIQEIQYSWDREVSQWVPSYKNECSYNNLYSFSDLIMPYWIKEELGIYFNHMPNSIINNYWDLDLSTWIKSFDNAFYYSEKVFTPVSEINPAKVKVYPNPVSDYLTFSFSEKSSQVTFQLFDLYGHMLMSKEINSDEKVSMAGLKKGMYFYYLLTDREKQCGKLIKE